jgi:hypothetical protein
MSILIKGMEMPIACHSCVLCNPNGCWCRATKREIDSLYERQPFCPLVSVPPHGRECWIPVTERLPEDGVKVICISKNGRVSDCDCLKSYVTKFGNYDTTTHWMPLPKLQKEEEK